MALLTDVTRARLEADAQEIIARYPVARSALLPMLHLVQARGGLRQPGRDRASAPSSSA